MANLNLSQFGEKLFVADADHTFIWDTVGAISKRVSRNSWLNSGTLTSDAPVTISQTWNGTGSTVFTALKVNATTPGTTSSSSSLLLDLQVGGVSKFNVDKAGSITIGTTGGPFTISAAGNLVQFTPNHDISFTGLYVGRNASTGLVIGYGANIVSLHGDAANTLALRNGANAQTFNVYGTYTSGTSYERLTLSAPSAANAIIGTNKGSGGGTARGLEFQTDGVSRWSISTAGHLLAAADNTYDIGASGANRPRNVYAGSAITAGGGITGQYFGSSAGGYFNWTTRSNIFSPADGVIRLANDAQTDFNRLQFGGTTNLFPALKRSSTTIQARLADDTAFAPIQGKLTTDTAYTGTVVAATGYITIYDSTGTAYRVPCAL